MSSNKKKIDRSLSSDEILSKAITFHQTGNFEKAESYYQHFLDNFPNNTMVLTNLATLSLQMGKIKYAIEIIEKSLDIDSNQPSAFNNHGVMLQKLNRNQEALISFNIAIDQKRDYAEAYANKANSLSVLKNFKEAQDCYDLAIKFKPDYLKAFLNKGRSLKENGQFEKALLSFQNAYRLNPNIELLSGELLETQMHLCIWDDIEKSLFGIRQKVNSRQRVINPFPLLGLLDDPGLQRKCAETYTLRNFPKTNALPNISGYREHSKVRIGYFSADFHDHATMHLMAELFECHSNEKFKIIAFSFGPSKNDLWRERVKSSFDEFLDVRLMSDHEVALLAREKEIDIAVDLKGFTHNSRPQIFAEGCAPIQVSYLGYPGTMGADYIDYLIADEILIPQKNQKYYSEKIVYMPNSYQVNMSERVTSNVTFSRDDLGLPETSFVFCCFNNLYKILPKTFLSWIRILNATNNSVLWLLESNTESTCRLKQEAKKNGINEDRLIFAKHLPVEEHLKRINQADLFLDTSPYNAHTTCSDSLRMGLPVLTLMGKSFASRVSASLLSSLNLSELIVSSQKDYESLAVELATNTERLKTIKAKLTAEIVSSSLFDSGLFTRQLEEAFITMTKVNQNNLKLKHIYLDH